MKNSRTNRKYFLPLSIISCLFLATTTFAEQSNQEVAKQLVEIKTQSKEKTREALEEFKQFNGSGNYSQSPNFWGSQIIYQIQVDRFNDGDHSNNSNNLEDFQISGDPSRIMNYRHGGDLAGVIQRLPYLKNLGITSLWLTPVFQHNGSYHGYCTTDFYNIDPGFGTKELFRELVQKAHSYGIRVILDIVVNHMCDRNTWYDYQTDNQDYKNWKHQQCSNELDYKNWKGEYPVSQFQTSMKFSANFFKYFKFEKFFNRCGPNSTSEMQGNGPAAIYGDFVNGMYDFNTRDQDFQELFAEMLNYWIAYSDLDGYRFDAAKHVSEDYVAYLSTKVREFASNIGKNNFFIVGEVAGPSDWIGRRLGRMYLNPNNPIYEHGNVPQSVLQIIDSKLKPIYQKNSMFPNPGLNAAYDFAHGGTALAVLQNWSQTAKLEDHFRSNYYNDIAGQADPRMSWNLLEIHDWPRFASYNPQAIEKSKLGIAYLATAEGSPVIYYGLEQGFNGICPQNIPVAMREACSHPNSNDAFYRQDMFISGPFKLGSTVPEIQSLASIQIPNDKFNNNFGLNDPYTNQNHDLFKMARKLLHLRQSCKALSFGSTRYRWSESYFKGGILAFSRIDNMTSPSDPAHEVLVIINTAYETINLPTMRIDSDYNSNSRTWMNLLNGYQRARVISNGDGSAQLSFDGMQISGNSIMVFTPVEEATEYNTEYDIHFCK